MATTSRVLRTSSGDQLSGLPRFWRNLRHSRTLTAYLFLAPTILGLMVFTLIPFLASLYFSFTKYNVLSEPQWRGLDNYRLLLQSKIFWTALGNTIYYTAGTLVPKVALGLALAMLLNRTLRGISIFRVLFYSPVVTATVSVSVIWLWIYNPSYGLLNIILESMGLSRQLWLLDPALAMPSLMALGVWKWVGQTMIIYLAGLQGIPEVFYEAAAIDGANRWQQFRHVTLPLLKPVTFFVVVVQAISSFQVFEQMYVMTEGGPGYATATVVYEIYREAFQKFHMGYASAIAFVLFIFILILTLINFRVGGQDLEY